MGSRSSRSPERAMQRHDPALSRTATAAAFFIALLASLLLTGAPAYGQVTIASNAAYACDFENSYCYFTEQSKIEPGRRSSFVASTVSGTRGVKLTTLPGDNNVHGSGT